MWSSSASKPNATPAHGIHTYMLMKALESRGGGRPEGGSADLNLTGRNGVKFLGTSQGRGRHGRRTDGKYRSRGCGPVGRRITSRGTKIRIL